MYRACYFLTMDLDHIEKIARSAALKAQGIQQHYFKTGVVAEKKGTVDLVTQADLESEKAILSILKEHFPNHQFIAEETHNKPIDLSNQMTWIIDPLDGTSNFAHQFPYFGISIALHDRENIIFALIVHTILDDWYVAKKGQGTYKNNQKIHVSSQNNLDQAFLSTGFPYDKRKSKDNNLKQFSHFELNALCVRRAGAAAIDLAYIACGSFDAFWEKKLKPWDIAAGILLIEEAGGTVTNFLGKPIKDLSLIHISEPTRPY